MHPNPVFHTETDDAKLQFARNRGFGILAVNADGGPLLSHIPFLLSADGMTVEAHLVRSNPILKLIAEPVDAVLAISGPDSYVSPDWYNLGDQVPTWNYVAVHLRGKLQMLPGDRLHDVLERTSARFEEELAPKKPWTSDKMDQHTYQRMQRMIVPIAMRVTQVDGTWKLSQNKPDAARMGAVEGVRENGIGTEIAQLAEMMEAAQSRG